jgi:hypothetical protein
LTFAFTLQNDMQAAEAAAHAGFGDLLDALLRVGLAVPAGLAAVDPAAPGAITSCKRHR